MYVHMFCKTISEGKQADQDCGMIGRVQNFLQTRKEKPFYYKIASEDYTLDDIKHGMLRGNRPKPGHYMKTLSANDPKTRIMPQVSQTFSRTTHLSIFSQQITKDPRINFICLEFPDFVEHI